MNFFQKLIDTYNNGLLYDELLTDKELLAVQKHQLAEYVDVLLESVEELEIELEEVEDYMGVVKEETLKEYFYNKYPSKARFVWNGTELKTWCTKNNTETNTIAILGKDNDSIANNALKWVNNYMTYVTDPKEHWQNADETLDRAKGDCEDGAILMYNLMVSNGVPEWRIRLNAGSVLGGGHAYVTYLRESNNKWYILDWCYWYDESINYKREWHEAKKYFGVWFSWNSDKVWIEPDKN